jgi:frataxin-like iron-binding protein CyaY
MILVAPMTTEQEFVNAVDGLLRSVVQGVQRVGGDRVRCDLAGDVLTMRFADGGKCTLIRQDPTMQVWLADGVLAWYFDWVPGTATWVDGRGRGALVDILQGVLTRRLGQPVPLDSAEV